MEEAKPGDPLPGLGGVPILKSSKLFGVYFEYVIPKTVFMETDALSAKDAELAVMRQHGKIPGFKLLQVFPIENAPTFREQAIQSTRPQK